MTAAPRPAATSTSWVECSEAARSPVMLPIPGTAHLGENIAAAGLSLSTDEYARLTTNGKPADPA
jgi:aryl-alcohol dehydrogenase-like predicted oxidoreductase